MSNSQFRIDAKSRGTLFHRFLSRARKEGGSSVAITDGDGKKYTYQDITRGAYALGSVLARDTKKNERVAIMLPTSAGAIIAFLALVSRGRVPAMLNFTAGARAITSACATARATKIVTAKRFIEIANLQDLVEELSQSHEIVYLEDVREQVGWRDKALAIAGPLVPSLTVAKSSYKELAVILFTSGTEGKPKGVALSHQNILANTQQISEHVTLLPTDIFFNPLPTFHCYGLTAGALWPLLNGHPAVFHPSPLQTKIIPKRVQETGSTVMFATDTFLSQYMRASADGAMSSLRIAVCGAERVRDETRHTAERRFGFVVLEGYGVTEASPVLAANQPGDIRGGTVGKFLPDVEARLEPVEGLEGAGRLHVRGPNVMLGYITPENPDEITPLPDGWHDTGDVAAIDDEGYITIRGRLKRFAKVAGEIVSLAVVENCAGAVWPDNNHCAAILPDPKKGEQIILVTDRDGATRSELLTWAQSHGVPEISVPKKILSVAEIPVLGTGKVDILKVKSIAEEHYSPIDATSEKPVETTPDEGVATTDDTADATTEDAIPSAEDTVDAAETTDDSEVPDDGETHTDDAASMSDEDNPSDQQEEADNSANDNEDGKRDAAE